MPLAVAVCTQAASLFALGLHSGSQREGTEKDQDMRVCPGPCRRVIQPASNRRHHVAYLVQETRPAQRMPTGPLPRGPAKTQRAAFVFMPRRPAPWGPGRRGPAWARAGAGASCPGQSGGLQPPVARTPPGSRQGSLAYTPPPSIGPGSWRPLPEPRGEGEG